MLADPRVEVFAAETLVDHAASRRVMEKVGMAHAGDHQGEENGERVEVARYEIPSPSPY